MTVIENYVKKLPEIKVKSFNDYKYKHRCKNSFEIRFPNLSLLEYFNYSLVYDEILENLEDLEIKELEYKFMDLVDIINKRIIIDYRK